ncbi:hypothetical protein D3C80_1927110 [compost metagenome]
MSFWCSRIQQSQVDQSGLSGLVTQDPLQKQQRVFKESADRVVKSAKACVDLDRKLADDPGSYSKALGRSKALLKKARYSIDKYDEWVEQQQVKIIAMLEAR